MAYQPKSYKKFVATAATATLVATAVVPAAFADEVSTAAFTDVPASYTDAVSFLVENNFAVGVTPTQFGISSQITRGDAAIIIASAAGLMDEKAAASGFSDVPKRGAIAVNSLKAAKVVNGTSATKFGFDQPIKRGDAAIMFAKAFGLTEGSATDVKFTDVPEQYKEAVAALLANKVTSGISTTKYGTDMNIKRGDFAKFIYALKDRIELPVPENPGPPSEVVDGHKLEISFGKASLVADGTDSTTVTLTVKDAKTGAVATDADDIVLELSSSQGSLNGANTSRVVVQNGVATATLQSSFTQAGVTALVTAKLVEAAPTSPWHAEIGNLVANKTIAFTPLAASDEVAPILRTADTDEADRVTLYFDKAVSPQTFAQYVNGRFVLDTAGNIVPVVGTQLAIESTVGTVTEDHSVRGIQSVPGNPNALEVILVSGDELTPNSRVTATTGFASETDGAGFDATSKSFTFTDALKPEVTSVTVVDRNTITLNFSEPVTEANANISINGVRIADTAANTNNIVQGEFNQNTGDKRHQITVNSSTFFPAGTHSVTVAGVADYAGNVITTDSLDFTLPAYDARPAATVAVESPEQFRVNFNDPVADFAAEDVDFEFFVPSTSATSSSPGQWVTIPSTNFNRTVVTNANGVEEYVYELNRDWSVLLTGTFVGENGATVTIPTNANYSNFQFRAVLDADTVTSEVNGLQNAEQTISLNYTGSPLNTLDNASPTIVGSPYAFVNERNAFQGYVVSFNEPVKAREITTEPATPSVEQGSDIPAVVVEFQGTNAAGNKVTINGSVTGYFPDVLTPLAAPFVNPAATSADNAFLVNANTSLQTLVDQGYGTEWTLVVRNVTDDVGNAATSLSSKVTVTPTPVPFEATGVTFNLNGTAEDTIVIDYNVAVRLVGNEANALRIANYNLNGAALPGTSVAALEVNGTTVDNTDVVITLPDGTLNAASNTIKLSDALLSASGTKISGKLEFVAAPTAQ